MAAKKIKPTQAVSSQPSRISVLAAAMALTLASTIGWSGTAAAQSGSNLFTSENVGKAVGATAGALLGSQIGGGNGKLAAVALGTLAGYWAGGKIGNKMGGNDQSYYTPPPTSSWSPTPSQTYAAPVSFSQPKLSPLHTAPQVDFIDAEYAAESNLNVRGGPSTDYVIVDNLRRGENVRVVGKVIDRDWYMVSLPNNSAGFVYGPLLSPTQGYQTAAFTYSDESVVPVARQETEWNIAGLDIGMTVDEASRAIRSTLGGEPVYSPTNGHMTFEAGGCPAGYNGDQFGPSPLPPPSLQAGWKCLQAQFSGYPQTRLSGFRLVQATDHDSAREVEDLLVNRFGPVAATWQTRGESWDTPNDATHFAWGDVVGATPVAGGAPSANYELEAVVHSVSGLTVTGIIRQAPGSDYPGAPVGTMQAGLDSDLRL